MNRTARKVLDRENQPKGWFSIENKSTQDDGTSSTKVMIYDEIGFWGVTASEFAKELAAIDTDNIDLHLNSPGGEVFDGVAIYNALKMHPAKVIVHVDSLAASAASFIAQAGDEIEMARNSTMMIHDGIGMVYGNAADMTAAADLLNKLSNNIADIYAQRAGGTVEEWRAFMQEEIWYTPQEAVDAGLADRVVGGDDEPAAENKWDLSIFNYAGRSEAPSPETIRSRIVNRVKEARMTVKNSTEPQAPKPDDEVAPVTPDDGSQTQEEVEEQPASGAPEGVPVTPETPTPAPAGPQNSVTGVLINGVSVTDPRAIQAHIASLEQFRNESVTQARKDFVAALVRDGKIGAPQAAATETFALSLGAEQYESWTATYEGAVTMSLLQPHADGTSNHSGGPSASDAKADRVQVLKDIVNHHRMSGMSGDKVMKTPSYAELMQLEPTFQL